MECIEFHDKHGHFESLDGQGDKGDSFDDPSQQSEPDNDRNDDGDGPEHPDDDMLQRLADWVHTIRPEPQLNYPFFRPFSSGWERSMQRFQMLCSVRIHIRPDNGPP